MALHLFFDPFLINSVVAIYHFKIVQIDVPIQMGFLHLHSLCRGSSANCLIFVRYKYR